MTHIPSWKEVSTLQELLLFFPSKGEKFGAEMTSWHVIIFGRSHKATQPLEGLNFGLIIWIFGNLAYFIFVFFHFVSGAPKFRILFYYFVSWAHFSNFQISAVLTIFLLRFDGLLLKCDMIIIFPNFSEFFRILFKSFDFFSFDHIS